MTDQHYVILGVVGLVVFIVLIGFWAARVRRGINEAWAELARRTGLTKDPDSRTVHGDLDGRPVLMSEGVPVHASGRPMVMGRGVPRLIQEILLKGPIPKGFVADRRPLMNLASVLDTGHRDLDKKVRIDCPDAEAVKAWLTPRRREALLKMAVIDAVVFGPTEKVPARLLKVRMSGYKAKADWLEARLKEFAEVAAALDTPMGAENPLL